MDIVLVSCKETLNILKADPRYSKMHFHLVEHGPSALEGLRITNAHVDWYCFESPEYLACLERIQHSILFAENPGKMYLL